MDTDKDPANEPPELRSFEELDSLADEGGLTKESLQSELNRYVEAFRQEYETSAESDPENVEAYTKDFFKKNVPAAAAQIVYLASNAESESVRGNMAKYVIEQATKDAADAGDPIRDLLNSLKANDESQAAKS